MGSKSKNMEINILLLGDKQVGKTSLMVRWTEGKFEDDGTGNSITIKQDRIDKIITVDSTNVSVRCWDTLGAEAFSTVTSSFYRKGDIAILCFDITSDETFKSLSGWLTDLKRFGKADLDLLLAGCKADLSPRPIPQATIDAYAKEIKSQYVETSAKNNINVDKCFKDVVEEAVRKRMLDGYSKPKPKTTGCIIL